MQNRIAFLCMIMLSLTASITAQDLSLDLRSGFFRLSPQNSIQSTGSLELIQDAQLGNGHLAVAFAGKSVSTASGRVKSLQFIGNGAYYVWLGEGTSNEVWERSGFDFVYELSPEWKIDPILIDPEAMSWAIKGDSVDVRAFTFSDPGQSEMISELKNSGVVLEVDRLVRAITVRVPIYSLNELSELAWIYWIEPITPPLDLNNLVERTNHRVPSLGKGARLYDLSGKGVVVGEWDGAGAQKHIDYDYLHIQKEPFINNGNGRHATHVAGTVLGSGVIDPDAMGMAPEAELVSYDFYGNIPTEMDSAAILYDIELTQNSYSYGSSSDPCSRRGTYDGISYALDLLTNKYPHLLHVFAAGNSRGSNCLSGGYGTVHSGFQSSKNSLVVGAVRRTDANSWFHSYGPVKDGRLKPEICGVGVDVYSTFPYNSYRGGYNGTSMACPGVSGTAALIHELYEDKFSSQIPAHLLKGTLCNGADELGRSGPDYQYGYGRINARRTAYVIDNKQFAIDSVQNNGVYEDTIFINSSLEELKIMLCWSDPAASPTANRLLVNDLDLEVLDSSCQSYLPWILRASNYTSAAQRGRDSLNPIEQVTLSNPSSPYFIVRVKGKRVTAGRQQFSVNWLKQEKEITVIYPNGGEHWQAPSSSGRAQIIRWDDYGLSGTTKVEFSDDAGQTWTTLAGSVASGRNYYQWQNASSSLYTAQARIRVTKGGVSDTSNNDFHIGVKGPTPFATICSGQMHLQWLPQPRAQGYKVYMLDSGLMRLQGTTDAPYYTIKGLQNGQDYWVAIATIDQTGAEGPRSNGVRFRPLAGVDPVEFVSHPSNKHICSGTSVKFDATASGTLSIFYQWQESEDNGSSWRNLSNITTSLSITSAGVDLDDRLYRIKGVNRCLDTVYSKAAYLRVDTVLQYSMKHNTVALCLGQDSAIELDLKASNEPIYRWFYKKRITDNLTNYGVGGNTYPISNASETNEGYYGVQLVNQCGTVGPNSFTFLEVRPPLSIINPLTDTACVGATTTLSIQARGGDDRNYKYKWIVDGKELNQQGLVLQPQEDRTVTAMVFDNCSADTVRRDIDIIMRDTLRVELGADQVICNGATFDIEAVVSGGDKAAYNYQWSDGSTLGSIRPANATQTETYRVTVTDGCTLDPAIDEMHVGVRPPLKLDLSASVDTACYLQEFRIDMNRSGGLESGYSLKWDDLATDTLRDFRLRKDRVFIVEFSDGCTPESAFDTLTIPVRDSLVAMIFGSDTACHGQSLNYSATVTGGDENNYTYEWNGQLGSETMDIVVSGQNPIFLEVYDGCTPDTAKSSKTVYVREPLSAAFPTADPAICLGQEIEIGFMPLGGDGKYAITWSNGINDAENITVGPDSTTVYSFVLTDGCSVPEVEGGIRVIVRPGLELDLGPDIQKCAEDAVTIPLNGTGGLISQHRYEVNGTIWSDRELIAGDSSTTSYILELSDQCTEKPARDTIQVHVVPLENTVFRIEDRNDKTILLTTTESPNTVLYEWGEGFTSNHASASVEHTYNDYGTYRICKTETDNIGCERTHCQGLDLYDPFAISEIEVEVFPNPSQGITYVRTGRISGRYLIKMYDATGKLLLMNEGENTSETLYEIDLSPFAIGTYVLHVEVNGERNVFQLIKQ